MPRPFTHPVSRMSSAVSLRSLWSLIALIAGLLIATLIVVDWMGEFLWFESLGYPDVFWTIRILKLSLLASVFAIVFLYLWVNARTLVARIGWPAILTAIRTLVLSRRFAAITVPAPAATSRVPWPVIVVLVGVACIFAVGVRTHWDSLLRFLWARPYGLEEPLFGLDVGFYLFTLPLLEVIQNAVLIVSAIVMVTLLWLYTASGALRFGARLEVEADPGIVPHLAFNLALFLAASSVGYYLNRFGLLLSENGTVYGAGYTQVHIEQWSLATMAVATLTLAVVVLTPAVRNKGHRLLLIFGGYVLLWLVALVPPWLIQSFVVEPNELKLETPYLRRNIAFTREAFGLDHVSERDYAGFGQITAETLARNQDTVANIRLWDWRPLSQAFRQLQQIRTYYEFGDVDVDRYRNGDEYRQVMLAARELTEVLPGKSASWVNERLQYTHGYGLAMSLAAKKNPQGSPVLIIKDLPPDTAPWLQFSQPAIYYGERVSDYRLVNTDVEELDYPRGDENVYTRYRGEGGVRLDNFWKTLLYAWHRLDLNLLITEYTTPNSRIQLWRSIDERVSRLAPFLKLDADPYPVLSQGRIFWIQDAYTVASTFPYSEHFDGNLNYIRNSVKVLIDAYHGKVTFYVIDGDDPVLGVYREAFPSLFRPLAEMPYALRVHLRYPVDLFNIQVEMYSSYHMTVPQVFYNHEDLWYVPLEKYGDEVISMAPYYVLMRLPGEERLEFLLMTPLTPRDRGNMIAWLAARSDFPGYGELIAFKLPKERLILGPMQVEAIIDQDTLISQQLSLWDQRGSRVIRGNLLVIPIDESFIYVEPVYLMAENADIPQLKRVIVSDGQRLAMEPTVEAALAAVFGDGRSAVAVDPARPAQTGTDIEAARRALDDAKEALRAADWAGFGQAMDALSEALHGESPSSSGSGP